MPGSTYLPSREVDLLDFSRNFEAQINADPASYGLNAAQAADLAAAHAAYVNAFQRAQDPTTRTPTAIQTKNDAKKSLLVEVRTLVPIIQSFPGTTNAMRSDLGLTVRDPEPTPVPVPRSAPDLHVLFTVGRTAKVRLRDKDGPTRRGKPDGVTGSLVFMHIGEQAPAEQTQWTLLANVTRTIFNLHFPAVVEAGARVWLAARWYNAKAQAGPASAPTSTRLADGMAKAA